MAPSKPASVALALFVTVLWSSSWVLIRWGLDGEGLPPLTFAGLRYTMAAVVVVAWAVGRDRRAPWAGLDRRGLWWIVLLGVVMYTITQGAQFVAIANQPAATTSLVLSMTPLLVAAVAGATTGERPHGRQVAGGVLVALGAWAYFRGDLGATAVGMAAAVVGLVANVGSAVIGRRVNRVPGRSATSVTAVSMAVGSVLLLAIGAVSEDLGSVSGRAWLIIGWLAVVNTALAFTLWNRSLQGLTALESAGINNTMLVQIALLGWAFLGEPLGVAEVVGIVAVAGGVFLTQLSGGGVPRR